MCWVWLCVLFWIYKFLINYGGFCHLFAVNYFLQLESNSKIKWDQIKFCIQWCTYNCVMLKYLYQHTKYWAIQKNVCPTIAWIQLAMTQFHLYLKIHLSFIQFFGQFFREMPGNKYTIYFFFATHFLILFCCINLWLWR